MNANTIVIKLERDSPDYEDEFNDLIDAMRHLLKYTWFDYTIDVRPGDPVESE